MAALRGPSSFETPTRPQAGASLSGFQSPYTPPSAVQRAPPTPIFSTPPRETVTAGTPTPTSATTQTPQRTTGQATATRVETPKVGGKWTHPALNGIEKESRKFVFGEEDLKRLVVNAFLLYSMWWILSKFEEIDIFDGIVRFVKYSPRIALGLQIVAWSFRSLFMYNIVQSLLPLVRPKSRPLTTIPLTSAQRELIGLEKSGMSSLPSIVNLDITPIATTITETITPPRYKASPAGTHPSPRLTPNRMDSPRSVSMGTPSPSQRAFGASTTSSLGTFSTPLQQRPRSSSSLTGRKFASGVGGSPLGIGGSPLGSGTSMLESPTSRKASLEVFFRG